jgi:hypothetical protein
VDVVVDEEIAVLEVLAFADAVGGDEQVDLAFGGESAGRSFERGEKVVRMLVRSLRRLGSVVWLWPVPVTSAECRPSSDCAHGASSA